MDSDPYVSFKEAQKGGWSVFAPLEVATTIPAAQLVKFARLKPTDTVLDVGCGTGVVAITAAVAGSSVAAVDLCPTLLERGHLNASLAKVNVDFQEGDVEALPFPDQTFDVVLSQFGHMFAPRPAIAIREMLRVLKPGGTLAFSTWPPYLYVGRLFSLVSKYSPPPEGVSPPPLWGDPRFVADHLSGAVEDLKFDQGLMQLPVLSLGHYVHSIEKTLGPIVKLVEESQNDPAKLDLFRAELTALASEYFVENYLQQHFLMSRATKR